MKRKLLKITEIAKLSNSAKFPNYERYIPQVLIKKIENLNEDGVKISRTYLLYLSRNKPSKSVTVGSGQAGSSF